MDHVRSRQDAIKNIRRSGGLGLVALAALATSGLSEAQARPAPVAPSRVEVVRSIETARLGVPRPTRLAAVNQTLAVGQAGATRRLSLTERPLGPLARRPLARRGLVPASLRGRFRAIAFNPSDRLYYALTDRAVIGFDAAGRRMHFAKLRPLGLADPRALAFAPTGDPTDAPASHHLYIADRGDAMREGRIVEAAFTAVRAARAVVTEVQAPFIRSIRTSTFSPPAPDPAGIVYDAATDRFIISDSEVDEMSIYKGSNLFTTTRGSTQGSGTGTTLAFSKEPSGLGYDPATTTLYVSDDDGDRITVDRPGPDGRHGTGDDVFYRFRTSAFGSFDAEGVEFDTATGHLFICDGTGIEIYEVDPVNGVFGDAGDVVTHFDVAQYGMRDCEGIGIDAQRGTLMALDPTRRKMFEFSKAGALSRIVDLNAIPTDNRNLASITMAPSSDPTDHPATLTYWVADRHVDNGVDPNENDGLLHELSVPGAAPPPADSPPTVSITAPAAGAGVSGTVLVEASAADDSGTVSSVQVLVDGAAVGTDVNAADGWSVAWDTRLVANGGHTITAVATDPAGNVGGSAPVQVVVQNTAPGVTQTLTVPVRSGSDDASELQNGTVNRTTGDLELGSDLGTPTTTGMRFTGIAVPRGATISRAWVQFNADERDNNPATVTIRAQQADDPLAFTSTAFNVSSRPATSASATWSVPGWDVFGATGPEQRTPDLSAVLQEIVNRPGWSSQNALALLITGSGRRTAESFEGGFPPVLNVEFSGP